MHSEEESLGKSQHVSGDIVRNKGQSEGQGRVRNNMPSFPANLLHMEGMQEGMFILNTSEEERGRWFQIGVKQTLNTTLGASPLAQSACNAGAVEDARSVVGKIPWRRAWPPTPVFLPGESHGRRSLVGYRPQGRRELDKTEQLSTHAPHKDQILIGDRSAFHWRAVVFLLSVVSIIMVTRVNRFERVRNSAAYLFVFSYFLCNGKQNFPLCVLLGIF